MKKLLIIILCAALAIGTALHRDNVVEATPEDMDYLSALSVAFAGFCFATIIRIIRYVRGSIYGRS